jgi:UDP-N-acetylmuramoyl-tripeptide--D-alanyl-D-alanine ligase
MKRLYKIYKQYPNICTDTRQIQPDVLFFCLKGENFDGNKFALQAAEAGAKLVITEDKSLIGDNRFYCVKDVLKCLQQLARYHRKNLKIPVIGITGTNGKTTTKELINAVLSKRYKTVATQGNLNNHIGVPLTVLSIRPDDEVAIIEMGANHSGEIAELCRIARPTHGLITNIGTAHIEGFGTMKTLIKTKVALYRYLRRKCGMFYLNYHDPILIKYCRHKICKNNIYGINLHNYSSKEPNDTPFLHLFLYDKEVKTHLTGQYNLLNILAASTIGEAFKVPCEAIIEAIEEYAPSNNRSQIIQVGSNTLIADYYNANPYSMEAALCNLAKIQHSRKLAILGDMRELGDISREAHKQLVARCRELNIPALFVGTEFSACCPEHAFENVDDLNSYLAEHRPENSLILVKGSRGMRLEGVVWKMGNG